MVSTRALLVWCMCMGLAAADPRRGTFVVQLPEGVTAATPVELILQRHDFDFGTTLDDNHTTAAQLFWSLTPASKFQWANFEPRPGSTSGATRSVLADLAFARQHDITTLHARALERVWTSGFWAHSANCSDYVAALQRRITRDVTAFRGQFASYDVFGNVLALPGMLEECNLWDTAFADAFRWAHAADPAAKLCLSESGLLGADRLAPSRMIQVVTEHLLAKGAPINCIRIEASILPLGGQVDLVRMQQQLDLLGSLGLELYITGFELVRALGPLPTHGLGMLDEARRTRLEVDLLRLWFSHQAVRGISLASAGVGPAVRDLWQREWTTRASVDVSAGWGRFCGYYGHYSFNFTTTTGATHHGTAHLGRDGAGIVLVA